MSKFKESELQQLLNFVGYGRLDAPVWFVGMEERGGAKTIPARMEFRQIEDLQDAHVKIKGSKYDWNKQKIKSTWRGMCYVMLARNGEKPTTTALRAYQNEKLGRYTGETLLTELLPLPKKKASEWGEYASLTGFKTLDDYHKYAVPIRTQHLQEIFRMYSPQIVICYGRGFWKPYRKIFAEANFTRDSDGIFERARIGDTLIILSHHFTSRTMNKKIKKLARIVRSRND